MKTLLIAAALSLVLVSPAVLAGPGHGQGNGHSQAKDNDRGHRWNNREGRGYRDGDEDRRGDIDANDRGFRSAKGRYRHDNGLHLGQYKFARGERIPTVYLQPRYYVDDYRVYRLAPPPPGYRWVRPDDGRYLLISTATGLISQMLGY